MARRRSLLLLDSCSLAPTFRLLSECSSIPISSLPTRMFRCTHPHLHGSLQLVYNNLSDCRRSCCVYLRACWVSASCLLSTDTVRCRFLAVAPAFEAAPSHSRACASCASSFRASSLCFRSASLPHALYNFNASCSPSTCRCCLQITVWQLCDFDITKSNKSTRSCWPPENHLVACRCCWRLSLSWRRACSSA